MFSNGIKELNRRSKSVNLNYCDNLNNFRLFWCIIVNFSRFTGTVEQARRVCDLINETRFFSRSQRPLCTRTLTIM